MRLHALRSSRRSGVVLFKGEQVAFPEDRPQQLHVEGACFRNQATLVTGQQSARAGSSPYCYPWRILKLSHHAGLEFVEVALGSGLEDAGIRSTTASGGKDSMARELSESQQQTQPAHDEIARRAYEIFLEQGCPNGHDADHWLQAEAQLSSTQRQQSGSGRSQKSGTRQSQRKAA